MSVRRVRLVRRDETRSLGGAATSPAELCATFAPLSVVASTEAEAMRVVDDETISMDSNRRGVRLSAFVQEYRPKAPSGKPSVGTEDPGGVSGVRQSEASELRRETLLLDVNSVVYAANRHFVLSSRNGDTGNRRTQTPPPGSSIAVEGSPVNDALVLSVVLRLVYVDPPPIIT